MCSNSIHARIGEPAAEGYSPVVLDTVCGMVECRYYHLTNEKRAVIYVGGVGGNFDTPAKGLYPRLCRDLLPREIGGLRVKFRNPKILLESVFDVLAGVSFLQNQKVGIIGLVGHSFGGAVVIQAGARVDLVKTIVTLSTQSYGTREVANLQGKPILLIHGKEDEVLSYSSSVYVHNLAREPKQMVLLEQARHCLDEKSDEVYALVSDWITKNLV